MYLCMYVDIYRLGMRMRKKVAQAEYYDYKVIRKKRKEKKRKEKKGKRQIVEGY